MHTMRLRLKHALAAVAGSMLLAACSTSPTSLPKNATLTEAKAALGTPTATWPTPGGGTRLQYSGQPSLQSVWNVDFNAKGELVSREQMMTDAAFARVRSGQTTREDVLRDFGQPTDIQSFPRMQQTSYLYRYINQGGFPAAMSINFDAAGVVVSTQTGLDPWSLGGGDRR